MGFWDLASFLLRVGGGEAGVSGTALGTLLLALFSVRMALPGQREGDKSAQGCDQQRQSETAKKRNALSVWWVVLFLLLLVGYF